MRFGVISQWYDPEGGSAAVAGAICRSLAGQGHEIHVLTGFPNYPTGRVYPGYRIRPYQYEHRSGVHVHRVPLLPSHDRSAARRALTYLSFGISATTRFGLLGAMDAWLVYSTPATAAIPALMAQARHGRPYVLLVQDLWPDTVVASGFARPGRGLDAAVRSLHAFCATTYRRASSVVVTAPGMARVLAGRGVPAEKVSVVPNWVDESVFRPVPRDDALARRLGLDGFVLMYAGTLGDLQGLDTAVEAVRMLPDLPGLTLAFVGTGVAEPRLRAAAAGAANVLFLGQQPTELTAALMAVSDVQLVSLADLPLLRTTLPSKVQAVLAAGRPVIGAVPGDAADLLTRSGAGTVVAPGDAAALAAAIRTMYAAGARDRERMGQAGRRFYLEHLSARVGGAALADALTRAALAGTRDRVRPAPEPSRAAPTAAPPPAPVPSCQEVRP